MFNSAGMERTVSNKVKYLEKLGYEVSILTTNQKGREYFYDIPTNVKKIDLNINFDDYISLNIIKRILLYLYKSIIFRRRLYDVLYKGQYDVVVSLMPRSINLLNRFPGKIKTIYEHHFSYYFNDQFDKAFNRSILSKIIYKLKFNRFCKELRLVDRFVVLTEEDKQYWSQHYPYKNIINIPNSIEFDNDKQSPLTSKIIISVGRLDYQKGYDQLIPMWQNLTEKYPDWELHLYGDGPDKEKLLNLIYSLNLQNVVKIFPPTKEIEEKLLSASIYALSSRFEGLPMVLLEAMAVGLPVVAFACKCGPRDIIEDSLNGYLCDSSDNLDFISKLEKLVNSSELRLNISNNAKIRASDFSHQNIAKIWDKLFKEL